MSDHDEVMSHLRWLTAAVKHLLAEEAGIELDEWEPEAPLEDYVPDDMSQFEHIAVRTRPQPKAPVCAHRQQVLIDGVLQCAYCHYVFNGTGVRGRHATSPVPAVGQEDQFNHGSTQNPGTPLVPHSV